MDNADTRSSAVESDTSATPPAVPPAARSWAQSFRRSRWIVIVFVIVVELAFAGAIAAALLLPTFKIGTPGTAARDLLAPTSSMVHLTEFKIEQSDLTVATGGTLKVMNAGTMAHNLAVKDTALANAMLNPGGTADLALGGLPAGTYTVYCQVPGHEQAGMSATLRVIEASGAEDGYPVPQPYRVDALSVAPAQRFTVLIHTDNPGTWAWHCHIFSHAETDQGMVGMVTALVVEP